mmetsp:Transcript_14926/g.21080  ORF Transcript_14926/g.21080 Transcript_14926/m.21080 type:complete len:487 (-) Transcript_14926:107-1567(-)
MVKVTVKWNKEVFKDVELEPTIELFQAQLFALTGVPVDGQKILLKGKKLTTDSDVQAVKEGSRVMLMGQAEKLKEPEKQFVFLEDMTQEEKVKMAGEVGAGLHNLGNTCYMNSTLQCLRAVPELKAALQNYKPSVNPSAGDLSPQLTFQLARLFKVQDAAEDAVVPDQFTGVFRTLFPRFAEQGPQGGFMQQDADECLVELFHCLSGTLSDGSTNAIDKIFGGKMVQTTKCSETDAEPPTSQTTSFRKLCCNISLETNFMYQGIEEGLKEELTKQSPSLGRNALYTRESKISELPQYMWVQFLRFGWRTDTNKKTKKLRKVKYDLVFDIINCCDPRLKKSMQKARKEILIANDKKLGGASLFADKEPAAEEEDDSDCFEVDSTGKYELIGIVTHQGRTGDSGHYIGWTRSKAASQIEGEKKEAPAEWSKFDDDKVTTQQTDEQALNLCGGGDWHMSYLLLYKRIDDMKEFRAQSSPESQPAPMVTD